MEIFVRLIKHRGGWVGAFCAGLWLWLPGQNVAGQNLDTFNVGSGVPADNSTEPLVNYTTPINATNFFNDVSSQFSWNLSNGGSWNTSLYPANGWNVTLNFTNLGEMDSSSGFNFYKYQGEANNFYNAGPINCGNTTNAVQLNIFSSGPNVVSTGYGGVNVYATNIFNSGVISVGLNGLARFTGSKIDFTLGTVSVQNETQTRLTTGFSANVSATGQADSSTNAWAPANSLGQFFADGPMNKTPFGLFLFNSVPYFDIRSPDGTGTNLVVRMIFLQDNSVNVATNVYFDSDGANGFAHVEWAGSYTDPATGQTSTHYLYLDDDYVQGSSTNILKYGDPGTGVPNNYTFTTSDSPLYNNPATSGFYNGYLDSDEITNNIYSYVNAQLIPTSVSTNNTQYGPIALTNIAGRVEINAAKELNLSLATIGGMNYLLLKSTNQFDYDGRSQIGTPFLDAYLGSTNGSMAVTNLIQSSLPDWSGSVQAWTTRWFYTNTTAGINFDFRVLLVASQLKPTTAAQEQNIALYSSNNVIISDTLNITHSLYLNCTNLLITTNGAGNGAASLDGELNLESSGIVWSTAVPRLRCLTNNGTITTLNSATYGSAASPYITLLNTGTIINSGGATIYSGNFENYGFFSSGSSSFSVQSLTTTMTNAAVLASAGAFSDTASNLVIAGTTIQAGKSFTLVATNLLTDTGVTNGNTWSVGANYPGYGIWLGLDLPIKPAFGDLLGTTITNTAVSNTVVQAIWAGQDRGAVNAGFSNNAAIGQMIFDAQGPVPHTQFEFGGPGASNAMYVDKLVLQGNAANLDSSYNVQSFSISNNFVIYYAQATINGQSAAEKLNYKNNGHLRWVTNYAGYFSSTNIVYPDGTTNAVNAALAQAPDLDSDYDGIVNSADPTPVFVPSQEKFAAALTNLPPSSVRLQWATIPLASNYVLYKTNLLSPGWLPFTNFNNYYWMSNNVVVAVTNAAHAASFVSPQPYVNYMHPADNWEVTNVWVYDTVTNVPHFYRVVVQPN